MTYIGPDAPTTLEASRQLIQALETHPAVSSLPAETLQRHQLLHDDLELHQAESVDALEAWREALTKRWRCEVSGQRLYNRIVQRVSKHYGAESLQARTIQPTRDLHSSTPIDLLRAMQRLETTLRVLAPPFAGQEDLLIKLTAACTALERTLIEAEECEAHRRHTAIERDRLANICHRAIAETTHQIQQMPNVFAVVRPAETRTRYTYVS